MTRPLKAEELYRWVSDTRGSIASAFREVEQIQSEYQGSYTRLSAEHDQTLGALAGQIEAMSDPLDPALKQKLDAQTPVERAAIQKRLADLEGQEIPQTQKQADDLLKKGQDELAALRDLNKELNDREENLKKQLADGQAQLDNLNGQVKTLGHGLGFILHLGQIHALDRERFKVVGRMEGLTGDLEKVREQWKNLHDDTEKNQAGLKLQWQAAITQLGQLREEHDYLTADPDSIARHRALVLILDSLKTQLHVAPPQLDVNLEKMVELNCETDDFQAALGSVAGILGIAKGMDEGLARFGESVKALIDEQDRNSEFLKPLQIMLPDGAAALPATWDDLAAKAKDEKQLADHPADFVSAMKPFLDDRLTPDHITAFFNGLGAALQQATQTWK